MNNEIFGDYGFFSLVSEDEGHIAILRAPGNVDKEFWTFNSVQVVPLTFSTYLVKTYDTNYFVQNGEGGVTINEFSYDYERDEEVLDYYVSEITHNREVAGFNKKPREEIEDAPYKITDDLLAQGLIIIRLDDKYVLYDFRNNEVVSRKFNNIDEVNGELIGEVCIYTSYTDYKKFEIITFPWDILVGRLNSKGDIDESISQRFKMPMSVSNYNEELDEYEKQRREKGIYEDVPSFDYKKYLEDKNRGRK